MFYEFYIVLMQLCRKIDDVVIFMQMLLLWVNPYMIAIDLKPFTVHNDQACIDWWVVTKKIIQTHQKLAEFNNTILK